MGREIEQKNMFSSIKRKEKREKRKKKKRNKKRKEKGSHEFTRKTTNVIITRD